MTMQPWLTPIEPSDGGAFLRDVVVYANAVAANFRQQVAAQPEDQLKPPVGELLKAIGRIAGRSVEYRTEVRPDDIEGRPDIGVTVDGQLIGLVELKAPGVGARPETFTGRNAEQWRRFREYPNLIYTDGSEWSLYQNGERAGRVRISDDVRRGARFVDHDELRALETLFRSFVDWGPTAPSSAEGLARYLAPLTRILRDEVSASLGRANSPLRGLASEWTGLLFPEGGDDQFADAYAQTLTYALLLARFEGAERLTPAFASEALQPEHGLLAEALRLLEVESVRRELITPIQLLERAIGSVDAPRLNRQGDPWIYFYEQFLGAYDMSLRNNRGVYYTPVEVVEAQTRLAGELLLTRFNKRLAFADYDVHVLDPAAGTGAYLLSVLDHAKAIVSRHDGPGAVYHRFRALAERLFGFEILVGPYAVAHLRVTQKLRESGVPETARVYLTDTLESPHHPPGLGSVMQQRINDERRRAQGVKDETPILVCIGNPPYDREARDPAQYDGAKRKGGWVRYGNGNGVANGNGKKNGNGNGTDGKPILDDFLAPVRAAGGGVHLVNLYNDYVYFWRWALWKVFEGVGGGDGGIVTFITASSYLRGPAFAGMRRKMREAFDDLWIIDLEGDNLGPRKTENVFAIQTPVAIAIGVRGVEPNPGEPAKVWKIRLTGSAKEKLARLNEIQTFESVDWLPCAAEWDAPFQPAPTGGYFDWPKATDVFPWQSSGIKMGRTWPISADRGALEARWRRLLSRRAHERSSMFKESRDRKVGDQYPPLSGDEDREPAIADLPANAPAPPITRYAYRSFDRQWILADSRLGDTMRPETWRTRGPNQVYLTSLLTGVLGKGPAATASAEMPDGHHFRGSFGAKDVIPLWRDAEGTEPNVAGGLLARLGEQYGAEVSPERLFAYAYGVLAQPAYVDRFWEELEAPPLRLPITKDAALFGRVADLGARLLGAHTYGERYGGSVPPSVAQCVKQVTAYPAAHSYDPGTRMLRVGDGEFSPVAPEVWNYAVSGMPVVKSWLDRRKREPAGRKSSPLDKIGPEQWDFTDELLQLLRVLEATIALQPEGAELLEEVCAGPLFTAAELPAPTAAERRAPEFSGAQAAF